MVEVGNGTTEAYYTTMDNGPGPTTGLPPISQTSLAPSYPVYLDPMGVAAVQSTTMGDIGGTSALVPRVTLGLILAQTTASAQNTLALRIASQLDGLPYSSDGTVPGPTFTRELRYNIAWMLQRPCNSDRYTVRQQIVVYNRRAPLYAPPGTEGVYSGLLTAGSSIVTLNVGAAPSVEIRKGTWILDPGVPSTPPGPGYVAPYQAEFYRVVSVTDQSGGAAAGTYILEVHKPVVRSDNVTTQYSVSVVVMPGVCDVFQRPSLDAGVGP